VSGRRAGLLLLPLLLWTVTIFVVVSVTPVGCAHGRPADLDLRAAVLLAVIVAELLVVAAVTAVALRDWRMARQPPGDGTGAHVLLLMLSLTAVGLVTLFLVWYAGALLASGIGGCQ
jgi:hypothetical protein